MGAGGGGRGNIMKTTPFTPTLAPHAVLYVVVSGFPTKPPTLFIFDFFFLFVTSAEP